MDAEIVVAIITLVGVMFTAVASYLSHKHARAVNNAVNNRAKGDPTLYQLTVDNHDAIVILGNRVGVVENDVDNLQRHIDELSARSHRASKKLSERMNHSA